MLANAIIDHREQVINAGIYVSAFASVGFAEVWRCGPGAGWDSILGWIPGVGSRAVSCC
jgi:hypothetical protein